MSDILYRTDGRVFSYRVAGICVRDGKVLLQKPTHDPAYALPGGHVAFGETGAETLSREFFEETGATIGVGELKWVSEIFFSWDQAPCHQVCLFFEVVLRDPGSLPTEGWGIGCERIEGRSFDLEFHWVPLERVRDLPVYPPNAADLLLRPDEGVQHFVYRESQQEDGHEPTTPTLSHR